MVVVAHPGDEAFGFGGAIASAAAEGAYVVVVCVTRGWFDPRLTAKPPAPGGKNRDLKLGQVKIAPAIADRITQTPLKARLYLDRVRDRMLAGLEFHYGDIIINPLEDSSPSAGASRRLLMRDAALPTAGRRTVARNFASAAFPDARRRRRKEFVTGECPPRRL